MAKEQFKIRELVKLTQEYFPTNWLEPHNLDKDCCYEYLIKLYGKINEYAEKAFIILSKSILTGEYLIRLNIIPILDELKDVICREYMLNDENSTNNEIQKYYQKISYLLEFNINRYKQFILDLNNRYEVYSKKFLVNAFSVKDYRENEYPISSYFDLLFNVVELDYLLSREQNSIRKLILAHSRINDLLSSVSNEELKRVLEVIDQKSLFLLKKLLIEDSNEFDYMIDFKPQHYNVSSGNICFFSELDKSFDFYRNKNYREDSYVMTLHNKSLNGNLRIREMVLLMKYYKDFSSTTLIQINNLIEKFDEKYNQLYQLHRSRKYDVYALRVLKNYMYNCRISYKISKNNYTYSELVQDIEYIEKIQIDTGILNFYPYQKSIEFIIKLLKNNKDLSKDSLGRYLDKLDYYIKKYEESIKWCEEQCFMPIQNIYNDSISKVENFGVVFIPSTFCRPINYEKHRDKLNDYKTHILFLKNELSLREEHLEIESIKNEIDKSNLKNIELISIFTAIITFLFGTINFMTNGSSTTLTQQIYNIISIGLILLLFVSAIAIVTMRREKTHKDYWRHPRLYFFIIMTVIFLGLLIHILVKLSIIEKDDNNLKDEIYKTEKPILSSNEIKDKIQTHQNTYIVESR